MLEAANTMRKTTSIPPGCRERYIPLRLPQARSWVDAGVHHAGVSDLVRGYHIGIPEKRHAMLIATTRGLGWLRTEENNYLSVSLDRARKLSPLAQSLLGYAAHDGISMGLGYLGAVDLRDPVELFAEGKL